MALPARSAQLQIPFATLTPVSPVERFAKNLLGQKRALFNFKRLRAVPLECKRIRGASSPQSKGGPRLAMVPSVKLLIKTLLRQTKHRLATAAKAESHSPLTDVCKQPQWSPCLGLEAEKGSPPLLLMIAVLHAVSPAAREERERPYQKPGKQTRAAEIRPRPHLATAAVCLEVAHFQPGFFFPLQWHAPPGVRKPAGEMWKLRCSSVRDKYQEVG